MVWLSLSEYQKGLYEKEKQAKKLNNFQLNEINNFIALFCFKSVEEEILYKLPRGL